MMRDKYIASYDIGTSGAKIALVDYKGNLISSETVGYPLITPQPGWAEQVADTYWSAVCRGTNLVIDKSGVQKNDVKGIVFATQWKGIIPLDENDNVLHNAIIWLDGRAGKQAEKLNERLNTNTFTERDYWAKLMWVKEEMPEIYEQTQCFLEVNSFLKFKATGVKAVDLSNNFIHTLEVELQKYYSSVLKAAELDPEKFPSLVMPTERVGGLTYTASEEIGLCKNTSVFGGCGDIPAIAVGAGCSTPGSIHIYLGSSGWLCSSVSVRKKNVGELYQSFDKGKELMLYPLQAACMAQNWAIDQFYNAEHKILKDDIYSYIDKEIADIVPGSNNILATPWLHGELPPLSNEARMVFLNITNMHDRRHLLNAVLEGICYSLRWKVEIYKYQTGVTLESIRVVGGGASSSHWMQTLSNILQIPVVIPTNARHSGAIGSAFCAIVGLGIYKDLNEADSIIREEKRFVPNIEYKEQYDELYSLFKKIFPTMKGIFTALNNLPIKKK